MLEAHDAKGVGVFTQPQTPLAAIHPAALVLLQRHGKHLNSMGTPARSTETTQGGMPAVDPSTQPDDNGVPAPACPAHFVVRGVGGSIDPEIGQRIAYKGLILGRDAVGLYVREDEEHLAQEPPRLNRTFLPDGKTYLKADDQIWLGPPPRYGVVYDLKQGEFMSVTSNETKRPAEVSLAGKMVDITEAGMMIGRNHKGTVDTRHKFASAVSRDHAILRRDKEGRIWIEDISTRGTWLNGKRIAKGLLFQLGPEDQVNLGQPDGQPVAMHRMVYELIDFALSAS